MSSGCRAAKLRALFDVLSAFESMQSSIALVSFTGPVVRSLSSHFDYTRVPRR